MSAQPSVELVSVATMAAEYGPSCAKTILRKAESDPTFPRLALIGNRFFAEKSAWEAWKRRTLERALSTKKGAA